MRRFTWPVAVFSRGNAGAWGERWYGVGRDVKNVLYIRIGTGIGGGLVLNGQPYLGEDFAAGEVGHFTVKPDGALCLCGNRGCLATLASTNALLDRAGQLLLTEPDNPLWSEIGGSPPQLTLPTLMAALAAGNPVVVQAVSEVGRWIGVAMASIINLLNLDMIIIGGPMAQAGDVLLTSLRAELAQRAEATHVARVKVVLSALEEDAPAIGSASLILHQLTSTTLLPRTPLLSIERPSLFKQVGRGVLLSDFGPTRG